MIAGHELAVEHHLAERLAIDRIAERLAHFRRLAERGLCGFPLADVQGEPLIAELERRGELEPRIAAHVLDVGREQTLDQIEAAGLQIGEPHGRIDDRQIDEAVDVDVVLVPIVGEFFEHDAVLLHALDELVGAGAHRMQAEPVARGFRRPRRDHHAGAVGELRDQRRERRFEREADRERVDDFDAIDRGELRLAERAGHGEVPLE